MNLEQWAALILGGGFVGSFFAWLTSRHKPQVDRQTSAVDGFDKLVGRLQTQIDDLSTRLDAAEKKADASDAKADKAEHVAREATDRAEQAEKNAGYLAADMAVITDHHLQVVRGVANGSIPPWPPVPRGQNWLSDADYPPFIARHHDTGVPGVNPAPPEPPQDT